jgi:hypothetical protein
MDIPSNISSRAAIASRDAIKSFAAPRSTSASFKSRRAESTPRAAG